MANADNPGRADALGSLIIRDLDPGAGYHWVDDTTGQQTAAFAVLAPAQNPATDASLYTDQPMHQGLNYITMRDGVRLAATVRYPYGGSCSATSPCPTVIEYSGYDTAAPTDPIPNLLSEALHSACTGCGDPNLLPDSATAVGSVLARVAGFATVSLQMRGTGCSGGAFDLFGYPSDYDAYDAVEIVAHQSWVAHHKVGMVGISYSGLSQLPSAGTDPPDLAAIAPMSPTDDLFSTGYPGGIYNNGFAASWIAQRIDDAMPAAAYSGGRLVPQRHHTGPQRGTALDLLRDRRRAGRQRGARRRPAWPTRPSTTSPRASSSWSARSWWRPGTGPGRDPSLFDRRSMVDWASHIKVPVFLSGALQDEQTGPQWPALIDAIPKSTPVFANMVNGNHIDSTDPQTISRWLEFLDIYVADKVPTEPSPVAATILDGFAADSRRTSPARPPCRPSASPTRPTPPWPGNASLARHPLVRALFDNGAGAAGPGAIESTYSAELRHLAPGGQGPDAPLRRGRDPHLGNPPTSASRVRPSHSTRPADR